MGNRLTLSEFNEIRKNLELSSDTWADLWFLLNLTQVHITQLLRCRYLEWRGNLLILPSYGIFAEKRISLSPTARVIIGQRRNRYPNDVFVFQSHSLRMKAIARPVTVIAFNMALKKAAQGVTCKTVSSKSALCVNHDIHQVTVSIALDSQACCSALWSGSLTYPKGHCS
ncbi:hypothetical protein [Enterobacter ludwigii]|uniref:hypothetical protein n=1 Tax=Enterobacter ludwigii TaxID=299767 RepID=UPI0008025F7D|nr:hypothetical protein [Enterobacter ludwigii]